MIALDEVTATAKRVDLILNSCNSIEERTMAVLIKQNLLQLIMSLNNIPEDQFKELCKQQEEIEKGNENDE